MFSLHGLDPRKMVDLVTVSFIILVLKISLFWWFAKYISVVIYNVARYWKIKEIFSLNDKVAIRYDFLERFRSASSHTFKLSLFRDFLCVCVMRMYASGGRSGPERARKDYFLKAYR